MQPERVAIVGAGIGGLTLALCLHRAGIACRVYEQAAEIRPLGVGINILPHATAELRALGVLEALERVAVTTREAAFFNRFGQHVYTEPAGAGPATRRRSSRSTAATCRACSWRRSGAPRQRRGRDRPRLRRRRRRRRRCGPPALSRSRGAPLPEVEATLAIGCDGIHSAIRRQLHPDEGPPRWSGVNMWRGVTTHAPFLSGATMVRAGWLTVGKMVIYPIRNDVDGQGRQLVNWVAELEAKAPVERDWNARGRLGDFFAAFADWHFDWLDVAALIEGTETVLAYPMVDQDPLPRWSFGRVTLLGDAAHPMVPRGSNGAGQAILDARFLADRLLAQGLTPEALTEYDRVRNAATAKVVLMNRSNPPDAILREVHERSGDRPFARIEDVVSRDELARIADAYKQVAGLRR